MRLIRDLIEGHKLYTVTEDMTILDVARFMVKKKIGAVPVTNDKGRVIGIFTERDLLKRVVAAGLDPATTIISEVMTRKLYTANADASPVYCLRIMKERGFRHLLIVDGQDVVGIVSQRALIEIELSRKTKALQSIDA